MSNLSPSKEKEKALFDARKEDAERVNGFFPLWPYGHDQFAGVSEFVGFDPDYYDAVPSGVVKHPGAAWYEKPSEIEDRDEGGKDGATEAVKWVCPAHNWIKGERAGFCPLDGRALVQVKID